MAVTGRGAWSKIGMSHDTIYYQLVPTPTIGSQKTLGPDYAAVNYAVLAIQRRVIALGYPSLIPVDGIFGPKTEQGVRWAQGELGLKVDGQFGPKTSLAFFWPVVKSVTGPYAKTVGGVAQHESGWDPGAVGFSTPEDHGLVQINQPANPKITLTQAFSPRFAFGYCKDRIATAMNTYHNLDIAICSYASPLWAQQWSALGHAPNDAMQKYVDFVQAWSPPS